MNKRFNPAKLEKLNNPARLEMIDPAYIWDRLKPEKHETKVEIGAGTGIFSLAFQNLSGQGKTFALDIAGEMVSYMKENVASGHPEIIPRLVAGNRLPLEEGTADLVYMITVHHELDDPRSTLEEARRILRKGGRIFIVDWNGNSLEKGPSAAIRITPEQAAAQLEEAGFRHVEIDPGFENFFLVLAEA